MGKAHAVGDYPKRVKIFLVVQDVTTLVSDFSRYLEVAKIRVVANWGESWDTVSKGILSLNDWMTWATYEVDPFLGGSEAYNQAYKLGQLYQLFAHASFWDIFSEDECDLVESMAYIIEDICKLQGIDFSPIGYSQVVENINQAELTSSNEVIKCFVRT